MTSTRPATTQRVAAVGALVAAVLALVAAAFMLRSMGSVIRRARVRAPDRGRRLGGAQPAPGRLACSRSRWCWSGWSGWWSPSSSRARTAGCGWASPWCSCWHPQPSRSTRWPGAPRARRTSPTRVSRCRPPRYPVLIMNPKSGGGKVERFHMVDEAQKRGIESVVLHPGDDLLGLARDAVEPRSRRAGHGRWRRVPGRGRSHSRRTRRALRLCPGGDQDGLRARSGYGHRRPGPSRSPPSERRWSDASTWAA